MKKSILFILFNCYSSIIIGQNNFATTSNQISNSSGSISYTIGQVDYIYSTNTTNSISEGVQQPVMDGKLNLKLFIEGYYDSELNAMQPVKFNQGVSTDNSITDDITVELRNSTNGNLLYTKNANLSTFGECNLSYNSSINGNYYLVIKHRNSLETWSSSSITIKPENDTFYDFTNSSNKAFGNNLKEVETGVFAIYSGDLNQDLLIDPSDYSIWEQYSDAFSTGYFASDLNGDGVVDPSDYSIWEINSDQFINATSPFF